MLRMDGADNVMTLTTTETTLPPGQRLTHAEEETDIPRASGNLENLDLAR